MGIPIGSKSISSSLRAKVGQGDIIHRPASGEDDKPRWGFVVTADCDIFLDKAGSRLSYLEVVTANDYLENFWSAEIVRKLRDKTVNEAASLVTNAARSVDADFNEISPNDLLVWLRENPSHEIVEALQVPIGKRKLYCEALELVELVFDLRGNYNTALQRLCRVWAIQKTSTKTMRARLEEALDYNKATDFHLIPSIPGSNPLGYVVLLREVSSIYHEDLHASPLDLQISGNSKGYYIAGPSTDNLRYAISQKMAYLFSRIGMSSDYEAQCEIVTKLAIEEIASLHNL